MSQKFQASVNQQSDVSYVKLAGVIDEDNELGDLVDRIPSGTAVIDLGEIERINSCGVRDWVNWLSRLEGNKTKVVMVECSPAIVAQINLVNNFTGNGVVKSFFVPYFCPECDEEKVLLVEASDMGPPPHEPPTCRCDECDLVMDFDDMPDSYFAFLTNQRKIAEVAMKGLGGSNGGAPGDKAKIRARATGSPSMAAKNSSLPSVPSLPSISRSTGSGPGVGIGSRPGPGSNPGTGPGTGPGGSRPGGRTSSSAPPGSRPSFNSQNLGAGMSGGMAAQAMMERPAVPQPKSNAMIYVLVVLLLGAIGVLAYLLVTR
jgi:anti-anti-sigma regulatory factor